MRTKIIYEDNAIIVAYKPAGLATQSARITQPDVVSELNNYLATQKSGSNYLGLVHRLDQPVEGLLVFGKTKQATAKLSEQFSGEKDENCEKTYLAVAYMQDKKQQIRNDAEVILTDYLIKDNKTNLAKVVSQGTPNAKKAVLSYLVLNQKEERVFVQVSLKTGRFHQIRVQMANAGLPLLGDLKYGTQASIEKSKQLNVRTVALCAAKLSFLHPVTGKEMDFSVEPQNLIFR